MGVTTVLRGFKVNVSTLDAFLCANGVFDTHGAPPFFKDHPDKDPISILLFQKVQQVNSQADKMNFRVVMPSLQSHSNPEIAYVTYVWIPISAHRELKLEDELPSLPPAGFEELRKEILSYGKSGSVEGDGPEEGKMGLYVVYTHGIRGLYTPNEYLERQKVPQYCDRCDAVFGNAGTLSAWDRRQDHRKKEHGIDEGRNPLPNA